MTFASILIQLLNGLAAAASLFLVSAGLSLIFGVTRIVNFAHGSLYMLGLYGAYTLIEALGRTPLGFWSAVVLAALAVGLVGVLIEVLVLRRIYRAPELFQLLATFAVVLVIKDIALFAWGAEDLVGPRAPGLSMAVEILGKRIPVYDLLLIAIGPVVLGVLWLLLTRTRWGALVRAATQDREMVGALGVDQAKLFTSVFFVGSVLAGLGGALQIPREPANLELDLAVIADAFVVTVVGGLGSIGGAFLAAILIGVAKAFCIGIGTVTWFGFEMSFSKLTLVVEFLIMARGAGGAALRPARQAAGRCSALAAEPAPPLTAAVAGQFALVWLALLAARAAGRRPLRHHPADRHRLLRAVRRQPAFHHGPGRHGVVRPCRLFRPRRLCRRPRCSSAPACRWKRRSCWRRSVAGALRRRLRLVLRAPLGRLSRHADARLRADQLVDRLPVGLGDRRQQRPGRHLAVGLARRQDDLLLPGAGPAAARASRSCGACCSRPSATRCAPAAIRRCAPRRSASTCARFQWAAFVLVGTLAGLAGAVYAFSKGSISPSTISIAPVDGCAGHGAAGRCRDADRADRRRRDLHLAARCASPAAPNSGAPSWAA